MAFYESVFIARQDLSSTQVDTLTDELIEILKAQGGEVAKKEYWGLKNLAYKIKKNRKGHYVLFNIEGPSAAIEEYERVMRYNEDVLRYLTVKVAALDTEPSAMMQRREERGGRGGGRFGDRPDRGDRGGRFGDRPDRGGDRPDRGGDRPDRGDRPERSSFEGRA